MEENELYNRIGETDLNPTYKDGQTYQHTDINQMLGILKTAINENYYDIQRLLNGTKTVGNANQLEGATLSRYIDETLQADDNKVPSSQQAKAYMDALFEGFSAPVRGVDYWTEADQQQIVSDTTSSVISEITPDLEEALAAKANINDIPTKISDLQNDSDFLSENNLQMVNISNIQNGSQITDATGYGRLNKIYGDTEQNGTPTPSNPIDVDVVTGDVNISISNNDGTLVQNYLLSLGNLELCKIGNYKDFIYFENGKWYKYNIIKKVILNGSESWTRHTSGVLYTDSITDYKRSDNIPYSDYYKGGPMRTGVGTITSANRNTIAFSNSSTETFYRLFVNDDSFSTSTDFKNWLSTHNVTVYYLLKNPVITEITDTILLSQLNEFYNFDLYSVESNFTITSASLLPKLDILYAITNRDFYSKEETNDIANALDFKFQKEDFYDEINFVQERYYNTDCYFTTIPLNDKTGKQIDLVVEYRDYSGQTPVKHAQDNLTTLTMNATLNIKRNTTPTTSAIPSVIGNGKIIREYDNNSDLPDCYLYVGIKANRDIVEYKVNSTTAAAMLADGVMNCFDVFFKLIDNGDATDLDSFFPTEGTDVITEKHPRQVLAEMEDKSILILTCDGRDGLNDGLTCAELQTILIEKGAKNAWNLDGGGSTSTEINTVKINRSFDNSKRNDRNIPYTINVKKETTNKNIDETYSFMSKMFQFFNYRYQTERVSAHNILGKDANELIGNLLFGFGTRTINTPVSNCYFINIPDTITEETRTTYNKQICMSMDNEDMYTRYQMQGVWSDWVSVNKKPKVKFTAKRENDNKLTADDTYQALNILSTTGSAYSTSIIKLKEISDNVYSDTIFKINKVGYVSIRINLSINSKGANMKFLKIDRNGDLLYSSINNCNIETNQVGILVLETYFYNDSVDNEFTIKWQGTTGDFINRGIIMVECD